MKKSIFLLSLLFSLFLIGCSQGETVPVNDEQDALAAESQPKRRLNISATMAYGSGFTSFSPEELGAGLTESLTYSNLKDVCITIDDTTYPLEMAIQEEYITVEEIFAYARLDARNGICVERFQSEHGLTHFTYYYPEYYLHIVYDVFEAPDGTNHLISDMSLFMHGSNIYYYYIDSETGISLDRENWGLSFEVVDVTPTSITLNCTQSGGQQLGTLEVESYLFVPENNQESVDYLPGVLSTREYQPSIPILSNAESQFTIDWTGTYGELSQGSYTLVLEIRDIFDPEQVHPLMEDFTDKQFYDISFAIP